MLCAQIFWAEWETCLLYTSGVLTGDVEGILLLDVTPLSLGVDYISSGALTHSAPILDLSLKHLRLLDGK